MESDYNRAIVCYTYEVNILHKHISNGKKQGNNYLYGCLLAVP